jgi:hypothetical protein
MRRWRPNHDLLRDPAHPLHAPSGPFGGKLFGKRRNDTT